MGGRFEGGWGVDWWMVWWEGWRKVLGAWGWDGDGMGMEIPEVAGKTDVYI